MKKLLYLLFAALTIGNSAIAAPGDTTWVQANNTRLTGGGNYDSTITFPTGGTYRNIYMIFTLGKYMCAGYDPANPGDGPGQTGWCGDWDYTVKNKLMTPGGDTLELGRFITPYANSLAPRTPWSWQQHYVYDVTDYASKLQGSATMRISFDAGSGGFTGDIKFMFIEGVPDRNVLAIEKLYSGSFGYGFTSDINVNFPTITRTAPTGTVSSALKVTVTGHGADGNGCCEFDSHSYDVMLNGTSVATKTVWRNNCGLNELYPQSGTWLYNRGNWCPGAIVYSDLFTLPAVTAGTTYNVAVKYEPYTTPGGSYPYYITEATLINYGGLNKTVDAGIEQIISPTNDENHFRENPILGSPVIHIKNRGAASITSVAFQYGVQDSAMSTYTWTGTLAPMDEIDVTLPALTTFNNMAGATGLFTFVAKITSVNGAADVDATDDIAQSQFATGPLWPSPFKIVFTTNNEETTSGSGISETEWKVYDMSGTVVASRTGVPISKTFTDTLNLYTGYYKLEINDGGCNGLHWWANPAGVTSGSFFVRKLTPLVSNIPMNGYNYTGSYTHDFGCNFTQYFYVNHPNPAAVNDISGFAAGMEAYPNPAQGIVNVDISGIDQVKGTIQIIDAMGRVVKSVNCQNAHEQISLEGMSTGVYTIQFINEVGNALKERLLITK